MTDRGRKHWPTGVLALVMLTGVMLGFIGGRAFGLYEATTGGAGADTRPPPVAADRPTAASTTGGSSVDLASSRRVIGSFSQFEQIAAGQTRDFQIGGRAFNGVAVPANATAVWGKLTAVGTPSGGYLSMGASGTDNLIGTSIANPQTTVYGSWIRTAVGTGGSVAIFSTNPVAVAFDLYGYEVPTVAVNQFGGDDAFGVASTGYWTPVQARQTGVRRYHNWDRWLGDDQVAAIKDGTLIFYPTFLIERQSWSVEEARAEAATVVMKIGGGLHWIIGNELNGGTGYVIPMTEAVDRFRRVATGVREADPDAIILAPSTLWWSRGNGRAWTEEFFSYGTAGYVQRLNAHLYGADAVRDDAGNILYWTADPDRELADLRDMRAWADGRPDLAGMPIDITEFGTIHCEGSSCLPATDGRVRAETDRLVKTVVPALQRERASLRLVAWFIFCGQRVDWNILPLAVFERDAVTVSPEGQKLVEFSREYAARSRQ